MPTLDVMVSAAEAITGLGRYVGEIPGVADSQLILDRRPGTATVQVLMPRHSPRFGGRPSAGRVLGCGPGPSAAQAAQQPAGDPTYDVVVFDAAGSVEIAG